MTNLDEATLAEWRKDARYWRDVLPTKTDKLQADRVLALLEEVERLAAGVERLADRWKRCAADATKRGYPSPQDAMTFAQERHADDLYALLSERGDSE